MPTPVKCLLVDDRADNLLVLSAILDGKDVELFPAHSGSEALELLLQHDFALALIDVQMPEMDGFKLAELMRGTERTRHVPIIFVTAGTQSLQRQFQGYDAGAVDFLFKPITAHILRNKAEVFFELHRQRQQLAHELAEKSETLRLNELFMAVLGHDLRNPLHAILMSAEVLVRRGDDPAAARIGARILDSGRRMQRLIEDTVDLAQMRLTGGVSLRRQPMNLQTVLGRIVQEQLTGNPDATIDVVEKGNCNGEWDADRLGQAVSNLLANALRHGENEMRVRVVLDGSAAGEVVLHVTNAGAIPEDLLPHLFDPFVSRRSHPHRHEGLGLGLYVVKQIILAHGGRIDISTERHGEQNWTVFLVRLPRLAAHASGAAAPRSIPPSPPVR
jgi:signal transduction histidine kinase